ncbi:MAG TPA: isoprenylcysteine carboxylmethyltransferase family protein [Candidatus Binatus sp.]|nr:isoprenylcysteine carboxylmethyltransferase family protein [Candidatus Binatus sp.]
MERKKSILLQALCGAVVGVLAVRFGGRVVELSSAFAIDKVSLAHRQYMVAAIPWVLFSLYWEIAAKNAAEAKSSEAKVSRGLHVFLANMAILLEIVPIRGLGRFLPVSYGIMAAGFVVEMTGLFLAIWARRALGRNWSGEISIKVEHQLIRTGPYKRLRHPIYTGLLTMYVGTAIVSGTWLAVLGLALAGVAYWRKIRLEEANLNLAFGADYDAYRRESWALIPGVY